MLRRSGDLNVFQYAVVPPDRLNVLISRKVRTLATKFINNPGQTKMLVDFGVRDRNRTSRPMAGRGLGQGRVWHPRADSGSNSSDTFPGTAGTCTQITVCAGSLLIVADEVISA